MTNILGYLETRISLFGIFTDQVLVKWFDSPR